MTRAGSRRHWYAYVAGVTAGYTLYTLGAVAPYLRDALGLSDTEVGLHSTALAIGLTIAGVFATTFVRRFGETPVRGVALASICIAIPLLATATWPLVSLVAYLLIGAGAGTALAYSNATLAAPGGREARVRFGRAGVLAVIGSLIGPVVVAFGAANGPGWWLGLLPGFVLLAVLAAELRFGALFPVPGSSEAGGRGRLPRSYWTAWTFMAANVGIEFAIVFWAAPLVETRAGTSLPEATAVASVFIGGMFVGRLALALGFLAGPDVRRGLWLGLGLSAAGAAVTWLATSVVLAAAGLFMAGLGVAVLYPLGAAATLGTAPREPALAAARLTLASGLAILVAPFALGAVADLAGVLVGWGIVLVLVAVAFGLSLGIARPRHEAVEA